MIGRVYPLGKGFKGLVSYLETGKDARQRRRDRVDWVEFRNLPTRNARTAACVMAATASESVSGAKTVVYHFSVSCDPGDRVDPATLRRVADRVLRDLGLEEHEALIFAHKDRAHPHLHFVVNRVHPERRTLWRPWQDYPRIERSLRAQEQELGLQIVPGWNSVVVRSADGGLRVPAEHETGVQRVFPRSTPSRGDAGFLRDMTARAAPVLEQARSWAELERGLAEQGLSLRAKGGGFTLTDGTRQVKASEVGRHCSRHHLEKRLGAYPDYRARMAVARIAPARPASVVQPEATPPQDPAAAEAQAPARQQEPPAPALPTGAPEAPPRVEGRVPGRPRPQFGDAGHGVAELFGGPPPQPEVERQATVVQPTPTPTPQRKPRTFLREVQERAGPVLEQAGTWAELERGLAHHGLSLRESGGGFVVSDGEREVKASEVGRAFSRFHLEKRLGRYADSRARGAVDEAVPVPPAPAVEPGPAARQAEQLALPLPTPERQEGAQAPARPAQRFTLHDDGAVFGVRDRDGQVFFAETRARALAEVERANAIAARYPEVISMRHLREMDGAWRDARGLPRLPEPEGRRIVFPDGLPPLPPVARVQRDEPAPDAAPPDPAAAPPQERASVRTPSEPPVHPRRVDPAPPSTRPARPLTERERYRAVLAGFTEALAALHHDPLAARRAFAAAVAERGPEAVRTLRLTPEAYGTVRPVASRETAEIAGRWGEVYAKWQATRTRPAARMAAARLRLGGRIEEAEDAVSAAQGEAHRAAGEPLRLADRKRRAEAAVAIVSDELRRVYADSVGAIRAIEAYGRSHGKAAMLRMVREAPEHFGALHADEKPSLYFFVKRDTSRAKQRAPLLADHLGAMYEARAARPGPGDEEHARVALRRAHAAAESAQHARDALPRTTPAACQREAAAMIREAARGSPERAARIARQLAPMLSGSALRLARRAIELAQGPERERGRDRGLGL